jgi:uncharacterized protein (DUF1330 family)
MPAYLIVKTEIRDAEKIRGYLAGAPPLVAKHGGRYLVRGGRQEVLEGSPDERRTVILEFPTMEAARALFDDPEYSEVREIRLGIADYDVLLVEGYEA